MNSYTKLLIVKGWRSENMGVTPRFSSLYRHSMKYSSTTNDLAKNTSHWYKAQSDLRYYYMQGSAKEL